MLSCFFIISWVKWGLLFEIIGALVILVIICVIIVKLKERHYKKEYRKMLEDSAIPTIKSIKKTLNDKRKNEEN